MFRIFIIIFAILISSILCGQNFATIKVKISDIELNGSRIFVGLYDNELSYKQKTNAVDSIIFIPKKETTEIYFNHIPVGVYAIALFQDLNYNGKLDTKELKIPIEPIGISNYDANKPLLPPKFKKAHFTLIGDTMVMIPLISEKKDPEKE